ncbi:MAG: gluconate 2-dehydrogenase subunit 3 family protein [Akkermansiaceae bacterium]
MNSQDQENRLPRRRVLQWFAAVAAAEGMALPTAFAQNSKPASTGYGQDPVMAKSYERGELWPLMMTEAERSATIALADVIFPADDLGPAASEVRVADFIDEWISAPYVRQKGDRGVIIPGLKALNKECRKHFGKIFADLSDDEKKKVCDVMAKGNHFFNVFVGLSSGAYYSDPRCWKALGYEGNTPYGGPFKGPPKEVLKAAGVKQTVA